MNILFLMAGKDRAEGADNGYPVILTEVHNKPLLQWHIELAQVIPDGKMIFAIKEDFCKKYHIDNSIRLLSSSASFVYVAKPTKGSACTALLTIQHINNDEPLLIVNTDEIIRTNYLEVVQEFKKRDLDAGAIVFDSIHPRYSFLKLDEKTNLVTEAAEKNPISKNASAGFYYFKRGSSFVKAAQTMIKKGATIDDNFYISPTFNELILNHAKIGVYKIDIQKYIPLKSEANLNNLNHLFEGS